MDNILMMTDSYKASHFLQYPPKTEYVSSYIESRGGKWDRTVFFGLQMFLMKYLSKPITLEMINEAEVFWSAHGEPFNRDGWMYILNKHNGYLPVSIEALPEGTVIETKNCLVQLINTDPMVPWLTSFLETALLRAIWYPTTVATNSYMSKQIIYDALQETADDPDAEIAFKLHDFGARGVSSSESAEIGGAAHLVNFAGSDTVEGVIAARKYYGEPMAATSIVASEHSTITSWGGEDGEIEAMKNMVNTFAKPGSIVACVSDSYDIYRATEKYWGGDLHQMVKDSGATLVIRPDSGDPTIVPVEVVELLMSKVGYTVNSKGYKVLPDYYRVIQGDGIDGDSIRTILENMKAKGLSASNITFGQGGGLLQQVDRDTLKFAMKASAIKVGGYWKDVFKDPVTDKGKKSKRGILAVVAQEADNRKLVTIRKAECATQGNNLQVVFANGKLLNTTTFAEIRDRANSGIKT